MKILLSSVLIVPLLAAAAPAPAVAAGEKSVRIRYDDLDLAADKGRATFERRVRLATRRICGTFDRSDLGELASIAECHREVAGSVAEKMAPVLAARQRNAPVRGTR
ncbi:UrcA family protein [Sphingomonas parva]|uniref:UrcA family protein n=1 Tax=Sphingomonas parva TaxID=2555898 RepID=A0A4Y8ZNY4_9SPHN|nr:UrcA family protein [Sphingomonas parva]TFI57674.1 UrcA family protein [Sphingomonas parva]